MFLGKATPRKITAALAGGISLPLEPENISTITLYQIHINLWGTLLAANPNEALASLVSVSEDGLVYVLRVKDSAKFSNGRKMTADDAVFSINRIVELQQNGHFNAKAVLKKIHALSERDVEITLNAQTPSFLFLLSIPEMGIVPRESIVDGKLKDCSITSGPYFVTEANSEFVALRKNAYSAGHNPTSPDEVELRFYPESSDLVSAALAGGADFIEAHNTSEVESLHQLRERKEFSQLTTRPSLSFFALLNADSLDLKQRRALSSLISQKLTYRLAGDIERRSFELSPPKTFASLGLSSPVVNRDSGPTDLPKSVRMVRTTSPLHASIAETLEANGVKVEWIAADSKLSPDIRTRKQGMNTNFPEIEYHLMMLSPWAIFKATDSEREQLLQALQAPDSSKRAELIQSVSRALVEDARAVPLLVRSYVHAINTNKINPPKFSDYDGEIRFSQLSLK